MENDQIALAITLKALENVKVNIDHPAIAEEVEKIVGFYEAILHRLEGLPTAKD